jgi:hypothetical protein
MTPAVRWWALAALLLTASQLLGGEPAPDAVEVLRTALGPLHRPVADQPPAVQKAIKERIEKAARRITGLSDLFRAVMLVDWPGARMAGPGRPPPGFAPPGANESVEAANKVRQALVARLVASVRGVLAKGDPSRRQAVLVLVATVARSPDHPSSGPSTNIFANLKKDVLGLLKKEKEVSVRIAALRTLPHLGAPLTEVAPAVGEGLKGKDVGERRASAEILQSLLAISRSHEIDLIAAWTRLHEVIPLLLPLSGQGAGDSDAVVRRLCLAALASQAEMLSDFPIAIRQLSDESMLPPGAEVDRESAKKLVREFVALCQGLNQECAVAHKALKDADLAVCLTAHKAIENAATVRFRLGDRKWLQSVIEEKKDPLDVPVKAVQELVESLKHREVRVRLAALYALETLAADAAKAAGALAGALRDDNRFVRWGAARALRNMAPAGAAKGVRALAGVLTDDSADVRNTAAVALARCRAEAKSAVPALERAVAKGDAKMRVLAARALAAVGKEAKKAESALTDALKDERPDVRAEAATALGRLGKLKDSTRAALTKALEDPDFSVQRSAAEALLAE